MAGPLRTRCVNAHALSVGLAVVACAAVSAAPYHIGVNGGWVPNLDPAVVADWAFDCGADMPRVACRLDLALQWGVGHADANVSRFCAAGRHPILFLINGSARHVAPDGKADEGCEPPRGLWEAVFTAGGDDGAPDAEANKGNQWARFVWEAVERYDGDGKDDAPGSPRVEYFSLWNEPDWVMWPARPTDPRARDLRGWFGYTMEDLARFVFVSWQAAKRADPNCKVGIQLCFPETLGFLLDDKRYPAARYLDFVDFHAYAGPGSDLLVDDEAGGLTGVFHQMAAEFDRRGLPRPAFVCTECGHPGDDKAGPSSSEAVQRAAAVKTQVVGAALGLVGVCWYGLFDPSWQNMGLIGDVSALPRDGKGARLKDAFYAMRTMAELVGSDLAAGRLAYEKALDLGAETRCHAFRWDDGRRCYLLWARDPDGNTARRAKVALPLPAGRYATYAWDYCLTGKPAEEFQEAGGGRQVEVGIDPIYAIDLRGPAPTMTPLKR